jgi:hypothetical protein
VYIKVLSIFVMKNSIQLSPSAKDIEVGENGSDGG